MTSYERPLVPMPIPGPMSRKHLEHQELRESSARTYPRRLPIAIKRAAGSFIEDVDGNIYIDFLTGAGALPLGHSHPEVVRAVNDQLTTYVHGLDLPTPAKDRFTDAQLGMLPAAMRGRMKMHFCGPTGANGVEAAVKLCKTATGRADVVSFQGGFHGSTAAAMALSGAVGPKRPIRNAVPGVHFFPFSYCARCPLDLQQDSCSTNCATMLERSLTDTNGGIVTPAAVIMELVQGEGGVIPATVDFARRVRRITHELGIPLIVDEVQTGCGRTGTWFAFEQYEIEPDVIIASKALSGIGLPVAIIMFDRDLDTWEPGAHIGTFRGNQLAFAAGAKSVEIINRDNVLVNVNERGRQLSELLHSLVPCTPWISEVRGRGLMWGVELSDPATGKPATGLARAVQKAALENGLIIELGGRDDGVLRMLPALNVTEEVVRQAYRALVAAFLAADDAFVPGAELAHAAVPG